MSEEQPKICPFMSEPSQIAWNDEMYPTCGYLPGELMEIPCLKERCNAWQSLSGGSTGKCRLIP